MEVEITAQNGSDPAPDTRTDAEYHAILEACLFAAGHPLTYEKLAEAMQIPPSRCRAMVEKYRETYNDTSVLPRGILLVTFPDSCQLCTREAYAAEIKTALGIRRGGKLSQSLLEVLAVVAYNQPTTRAFVDTVRGVDSSYAVSALLEKGLIEPCGKLEAPGRPTLYRTTADFLRVFGIDSLMELPVVQVRGENGEKIDVSPDATLLEAENDTPDANAESSDIHDGADGNADDTDIDESDAVVPPGAVSTESSLSEESAEATSFALPMD